MAWLSRAPVRVELYVCSARENSPVVCIGAYVISPWLSRLRRILIPRRLFGGGERLVAFDAPSKPDETYAMRVYIERSSYAVPVYLRWPNERVRREELCQSGILPCQKLQFVVGIGGRNVRRSCGA